jgi:predicted ABC-type transport system involved in lysophospholipase L1 biosynthesis ATPase subunit
MPDPILSATALTKIVQSGDAPLTILDDVSFDVEPGATIAVMGASGSGKTTLLGLLAGLDRPTSGEVRLDGQRCPRSMRTRAPRCVSACSVSSSSRSSSCPRSPRTRT